MIKGYKYIKTSQIEELKTKINSYRDLFEKLPEKPAIQDNLLRKSALKSSLYSARIEGNILELGEVEKGYGRGQEKREVFQILEGLKFTRAHKEDITKEFLYELHSRVLNGLTSELGKFRSQPSAIFNSSGAVIYIAPPAHKVPGQIGEWIESLNANKIDLPDAAIAHFAFEKIHPFLDGNGRVGRILLNWHLARLGYGFAGLISFEEYLENNRDRYYAGLAIKNENITEFVEFILEAVAQSAEKVILELQDYDEENIEDTLLPRRAEILAVIRDHKIISFDELYRRFLAVNTRTLHYDLEDLIKKGLVKKLGKTRAAAYAPK